MSPCTTSPAAFVKSPSWNQATVLTNWCMPTGISARFTPPNRAAPPAPRPVIHSPKLEMPVPMGSQTRPKKTPTTMPTKAMMIGTSRRPLKKPSQSTSLVRWNRCHSTAASRPMMMPPRTPGSLYVAATSSPFLTTASVTGKASRTLLYTRKPTTAARAVEPSAFLAKPMATPMQNRIGSEPVRAPPALLKTAATRSQPRPSLPKMSSWPSRTMMPAAGSTAIGSCRLRPTFCKPWKRPDPRFFAGAALSVAVLILPPSGGGLHHSVV